MPIPEQQTYNLPGFGLMRVRLFPYAKKIYDFLEQYQHVSHLRNIDQLGPIRDVLPGAHHTRFEYLMAQLALLTELCHLQGPLPAGLSLTRPRGTFGRLPGIDSDPSNGEILMILCLLGNMGHLPTTFSGERALLKHLRDSAAPRYVFREGLPKQDRGRFNEVLDSYDLYRFHYYIALFLLNRYRRREDGHETVNFCQAILRSYLTTRDRMEHQALAALWRLYRSIRRLTYLALDSHYAPVPFSLDLASIFFSLEHFLTDVFLEDSSFQDALGRLEGVMRDTVYLAPVTLLNHARVSDAVLKRLQDKKSIDTITGLWEILKPRKASKTFGSSDSEPNLPDARDILSFAYDVDPAVAERILPDPMKWERAAQSTVGLRSCRFAADFDPLKRHLKVAASLTPGIGRPLAWKIASRVAKQVLDFDLSLSEASEPSATETARNGMALLRFLLPLTFGSNKEYRLRAMPVVKVAPVVWGYGSTKMSNRVNEYLRWASEASVLDADGLNEIERLRDALGAISYRGALVAFAGATEVLEEGRPLAEFDGLVFLLSREIEDATVLIVEAKNMAGGHTQSEKQLRKQFDRLEVDDTAFEIQHLGRRGAFARLRVGKEVRGKA